MKIVGDEKGVSPIIGFILVLMILVVFLSFLQSTHIPEVSKEVEADHIEEITGQLMELGDTSSTQTTKFDMGVNYPEYLFLTTPDSTATTMSAEEFEVTAEFTEVLPNGTEVKKDMIFTSNRIKVSPHYLFYPRDSLILENTALFKHAGGNYVTISDQSVFKKDIELLIFNTTFDSISTEQPLNIVSVPLSVGGVSVAKNISISFESANPAYWKSVGGFNVTVNGNNVTISTNETVQLRIHNILLCSDNQAILRKPEPTRMVKTSSIDNFSMKSGETLTLGAKVLDEYGNPVEGIKVEVNSSVGEVIPSVLYTDTDGEVLTRFEGENSKGKVTFSTTFSNTSYKVDVQSLSSAVFDVSWLVGNSYEWNVTSETLTRSFDVKVEHQNHPVNSITVDFSTDSNNISILNNENTTNTDGITSVDVKAIENGYARLFATCGGSTEVLNLTITGLGTSGLFVSDEVAIDGPDDPYFSIDRSGGVEFLITNNYGETVIIDKIEIDPTDNGIDELDDQVTPNDEPQRTEVYAQSDIDGYSDFGGGVSIPHNGLSVDIGEDGEYNSGDSPRINSGNTMRFYLYEFFDDYDNVYMQGKDIQITLTYTIDGNTKTKTFTITPQ